MGHDKDVKLTFTNHVAPSVSAAIEARLFAAGFRHVVTKQQVSVHLKDVENFTSVNVSFLVFDAETDSKSESDTDSEGGKRLQIRKVKTGSSKLFFLSVAHPEGSPDYRLKLLAQYDLPEDEPGSSGRTVWEYARACKWAGESHPFVESFSSNAGEYKVA